MHRASPKAFPIQQWTLLGVIGVFLVIGLAFWLNSSAANRPNAGFEAEQAERSGAVSVLQDGSLSGQSGVSLHATTTPRVIFDTDMGNDIDDAMALALLHAYAKQGKAEIIAVISSIPSPWAAPYIDLVNTFYGRGDIPVGTVRNSSVPNNDGYPRQIADKKTSSGALVYPHDLLSGDSGPDATTVLRQVLAAQPDSSVVFVTVGFSTNLARLLQSQPDTASTLNGVDLVAQKVKLLSNMAGAFNARTGEFNVISDVEAARYVYQHWPSRIVSSGFEIGSAIIFPGSAFAERITYTSHHPVWDGFIIYNHANRETWDLTSVIDAIEPGEYFTRSASGSIAVDGNGHTVFTPAANGKHHYLERNGLDAEKAKNRMIDLVTQAP